MQKQKLFKNNILKLLVLALFFICIGQNTYPSPISEEEDFILFLELISDTNSSDNIQISDINFDNEINDLSSFMDIVESMENKEKVISLVIILNNIQELKRQLIFASREHINGIGIIEIFKNSLPSFDSANREIRGHIDQINNMIDELLQSVNEALGGRARELYENFSRAVYTYNVLKDQLYSDISQS